MIKLIACWTFDRWRCISICTIYIQSCIRSASRSSTGIAISIEIRIGKVVENAYTISAIKSSTPHGVKIEFLCDPETISFCKGASIFIIGVCITVITRTRRSLRLWTSRFDIAPLIHIVSHVGSLIVFSRNCRFIQHERLIKHLCEVLISIPTSEDISITFSCGHTDLSAIRNTEVHILIIRAPVKRRIGSGIWMQEYTILDQTPLCIDSKTAFRHLKMDLFSFIICRHKSDSLCA